ncbi:group 1 truncated hemoglobin [Pseudooceanicola sp.]|uniref:group I truncated hemoglobin n=1 Tax=Pseudooceanicola sp. TaxID=1914328 RepID=UPI0035181136
MTESLAEQLINVTLYERVGGPAGIRRIVDGAVAAHMENPLIGHRFQPYAYQPDRVEEIKQHTCDFFAAGSGGPDDYRGRPMAEAHEGMAIDEAEYDAAVDDILGTMQALNHDAEMRSVNTANASARRVKISYRSKALPSKTPIRNL